MIPYSFHLHLNRGRHPTTQADGREAAPAAGAAQRADERDDDARAGAIPLSTGNLVSSG